MTLVISVVSEIVDKMEQWSLGRREGCWKREDGLKVVKGGRDLRSYLLMLREYNDKGKGYGLMSR